MSYHERTLPHSYPPDATLFVTWRLFGSLPRERRFEGVSSSPGEAFARVDRLLDSAAGGPVWLRDKRVAALVADALKQGEAEYRLYELFAWVIMSNHVHAVIRPIRQLPIVMRWLKGSTARSANRILGRTGKPFWQYETYDHCIRGVEELNKIIRYVERNPVRAGLAGSMEEWPWSSAWRTAEEKAQA
jgi:putative transposase